MESCQDCRFFHVSVGGLTVCRRYPHPEYKGAQDWCGEFYRKPQQSPSLKQKAKK